MKTSLLALTLILGYISNAVATAQIPDALFHKGKKYDLYSNPMEELFAKHPDKRPKSDSQSSALWRGYIATFEIKDKKLHLKDVEIELDHEKQLSVKQQLYKEGESTMLDWYSGVLVIPHGKMVEYVHMGYGSTYSNYILLEIRKGMLTGERHFTHLQYKLFKKRQYELYRKTAEYKKQLKLLQKKGYSVKMIDNFLENFVIEYSGRFLDEE